MEFKISISGHRCWHRTHQHYNFIPLTYESSSNTKIFTIYPTLVKFAVKFISSETIKPGSDGDAFNLSTQMTDTSRSL